jgi:hypothetical protein
MSEMIERVAEAIRLRSCERGYPVHPAVAHHLAAAAMEAMREPTPAMHDAAWAASLEPNEPMQPDFPDINAGIWQAMIDEAILHPVGEAQPRAQSSQAADSSGVKTGGGE